MRGEASGQNINTWGDLAEDTECFFVSQAAFIQTNEENLRAKAQAHGHSLCQHTPWSSFGAYQAGTAHSARVWLREQHKPGHMPRQGATYRHPCFKGNKSLGRWKGMYRVAWPHCQKPVREHFSLVEKAWLSQAFAKRRGFFPHPSVCMSNWHELPRSAEAVCAVTSQLYSSETSPYWTSSWIFILRL